MDSLTYFAAESIPVSSSTTAIIVVAVLSLVGTIATVGYKYIKPEKKDPNQIVFDQVNLFIAEQRKERDDLREEIAKMKKEFNQLTAENEKLHKELNAERSRNNKLERKVALLTNRAEAQDEEILGKTK